MCQLPVMNPMRTNHSNTNHQFEDPSEPIYTDPSLFERSRFVYNIHVQVFIAHTRKTTIDSENDSGKSFDLSSILN